MNELQFKLLRSRVATLLNAAKPYLTDEETLFDAARAISETKIPRGSFDYVISEMEKAGQVVRHLGERNVIKCKLTETGEAELLK